MKIAILILFIILVASAFYYNYKSEQFLSRAQVHEKIKDYERALDYYEDYSEFTKNNVVFAEKLFDIAEIQIEIKDYENAEKNLNHFKNLELKNGWLYNSIDSTEIDYNNYKKNSLTKQYIEIYENTDRKEQALDLYLTRIDDHGFLGCDPFYFKLLREYYNHIFDLCYEFKRYEIAFKLYLDNMTTPTYISKSRRLDEVVRYKISQFSRSQKDSIIQSAYDSIKFKTFARDSNKHFSISYNILGHKIPGEYMPRRLIQLDSNINVTDTNKIMDLARKEFENTWLYEVLAEAKY